MLELKGKLDQIWIRAKGPTWSLCPEEKPENTEVWGLNSSYRERAHQLDRLFILHDIRETMLHEDFDLVEELNELGIPVLTAGIYKVLDNCEEFPAVALIEHFETRYMLNAIAWMVALACYLEPKELHLYGVDYVFGVDVNEKSATEFWVGVAKGLGIKVLIPDSSHLLKPPELVSPVYGYKVARLEPRGLSHIVPSRIREKCASNYHLVPVPGCEEI